MNRLNWYLIPFVALLLLPAQLAAQQVTVFGSETNGRRQGSGDRERLAQLAHRLEEAAEHAARQIRGEDWNDRLQELDDALERFAERARDFHRLVERGRAGRHELSGEIGDLQRDAQTVAVAFRRSGIRRSHALSDWNQAATVLRQIAQEFGARDHSGPFSGGTNTGGWWDGGGHGSGQEDRQLRSTAQQLANRAERVYRLAARAGSRREALGAVGHFRRQAYTFANRVNRGLHGEELHEEVRHLRRDAEEARASIDTWQVGSSLSTEWTTIFRLLDRLSPVFRY